MKPIPFHFRSLHYVLAVADYGSTAAAARALFVSQPSVSQAVGRLESHFGQALFLRSATQGMTPTPFGRRKLKELRGIEKQMQQALCADGPLELALGVFSSLGPKYVPTLLRAFEKAHPEAKVTLHEGHLEALYQRLENGQIDLALVYDFQRPSNIKITGLKDIKPYALVSVDHPLATRKYITLEDLSHHPLILMSLPHSHDYFLSLFQGNAQSVEVAFETGSIEMLRSMVASDYGVGLLATELPYGICYDGNQVIHLQLADATPTHRIALAQSSQFPASSAAKAFIDMAQHHFQTH